jgi:hypothetical protein
VSSTVRSAYPDRTKVAARFESDDARARLLDLLGKASGYTVLDLGGQRIGSVVGLTDDPESGEQRLAIRGEGAFVWKRRRRLLALEAIQIVDARRRLAVVNEDRELEPLDRPTADRAGPALVFDDDAPSDHDEAGHELLTRLDAYTRPQDRRASPQRHLWFVSTATGYRLENREGEPPRVGSRINTADLPEPLVVTKVGPSPLPNDSRVCAFLERDSPVLEQTRGGS